MKPILVSPPQELPVVRGDAKLHCRIDGDEEDMLVDGLIRAATSHLDGWGGILGRCIITQDWRFSVSGWSQCIRLPFPDVSAAVVKYLDADNAEITVSAGDYEILHDAKGSVLRFRDSWTQPDLYDDAQEPVTVTVTAGYGAVTDVPAAIKHAILMLVCHWYESRMSVAEAKMEEVPMAFNALVQPHRYVST